LSHFNARKQTNVCKTCQPGGWLFGHARSNSNSTVICHCSQHFIGFRINILLFCAKMNAIFKSNFNCFLIFSCIDSLEKEVHGTKGV
jgi:hypothetical protein